MPNKLVRESLEVNLKAHQELMDFYRKNPIYLEDPLRKRPSNIETL